MSRKLPFFAGALALALVAAPSTSSAQIHLLPEPGGLDFPLNVTSPDQGNFVGNLHIERFAVHQFRVVAVGTLIGTLTDENGAIVPVFRTLNFPLVLPLPGERGDDCEILHLELGPLDLDLLGLLVHLNRVVLDIRAEPGAGNLLGNLLCAIVNLLNGPGGQLTELSGLLNQLLGILG
jgi:hypothetical protein